MDTVQNPTWIQEASTGNDGSGLCIVNNWYNWSLGSNSDTISVNPATAAGTAFVAGSLPLRVAMAAIAEKSRNVPAKRGSCVTTKPPRKMNPNASSL
mmetsp:Transcript_25187/g.59401  ORF Transcript_25187/g.59401 Transcript_25187/m.59401 type:complete len:97 (-) Transcript_25187:342-632(-)